MLTIAVDAMGGDHAPKREVEGAIRAARDLQIRVILVGLERALRHRLGDQTLLYRSLRTAAVASSG